MIKYVYHNKKYLRKCPFCNIILEYTNKKNRNFADKKRKLCRSCTQKEVQRRPEIILHNKNKGIKLSKKYSGTGNPFYGKKHSDKTKEKIRKFQQALDKKHNPIFQSKEFREKSIRVGKANGMYGRNFYDVWLKKYGRIEADRKMQKLRKKRSINMIGNKNPMYGKSPPKGSGGGWSGWYKKWFFRSLRELSYMINIIEKKKYKWESAENNKFQIKYIDFNEHDRTYKPDFLLNDKTLIEVKPKKLMETPNNIRKKEAAINFCKKNNLEYKIVDIKIIEIDKIIKLFLNKQIKFTKKYQDRIKKIIKNRHDRNERNLR